MTSEEAIYFGRRIENKSIKQNGGREHMFTTFITKVSSIKRRRHGLDKKVSSKYHYSLKIW